MPDAVPIVRGQRKRRAPFYVGRYAMGIAYLFTLGAFGIGYLVDLLLIVLGRMRDRNGLVVTNW